MMKRMDALADVVLHGVLHNEDEALGGASCDQIVESKSLAFGLSLGELLELCGGHTLMCSSHR